MIINLIYNLTQPFMVIIPVLAGICAIIMHQHRVGVVNLCMGLVNFFIFYGDKVIK